jgi:hypothetical protein
MRKRVLACAAGVACVIVGSGAAGAPATVSAGVPASVSARVPASVSARAPARMLVYAQE